MKTSFGCYYFVIWLIFGLLAGSLQGKERPLTIAHRGASGMFPEHTKLAYTEAGKQGADYLECDVTLTKDLELVCSHEPWISEISNVENHSEFASRKVIYDMNDDDPTFDWNDKGDVEDYFTIDFSLSELQSLRRKQIHSYRDSSYNWLYSFSSFSEFVEIAKSHGLGIYPELKQPTAFNKILKSRGINVTFEDILLEALEKENYVDFESKCIIQCFELSTLEALAPKTKLKRVLLLKRASKASTSIFKRLQDNGIYGIGLDKDLIVEKNPEDSPTAGHINSTNTVLIEQIHSHNLILHVYTFRNEWMHLTWDYGQDPYLEYAKYYELGIDGYFTDFPGTCKNFLDHYSSRASSLPKSPKLLTVFLFLITISHVDKLL